MKFSRKRTVWAVHAQNPVLWHPDHGDRLTDTKLPYSLLECGPPCQISTLGFDSLGTYTSVTDTHKHMVTFIKIKLTKALASLGPLHLGPMCNKGIQPNGIALPDLCSRKWPS